MLKEGLLWEKVGDQIKCNTCAHHCLIKNNKFGICNVRKNIEDKLYSLDYGSVASMVVDKIEKKPLFHFHPDTKILSLGTLGCNFRCSHCQNHQIAFGNITEISTKEVPPQKCIAIAKENKCEGIAFTFNEPAVWMEYTYDVSKLAKQNGLYTVYVTNGYASELATRKMAECLDAAVVGIKGFDNEIYRKTSGASLSPVLETCELMVKLGIHLELTYLLIPNYSDSSSQIDSFVKWVKRLGDEIPVQFTKFFPEYRMSNIPETSLESLEKAHAQAKSNGLKYVYIENVYGHPFENTYCPKCNELLIRRQGKKRTDGQVLVRNVRCDKTTEVSKHCSLYDLTENRIRNNRCPTCNTEISIAT